MTKSDKYYTEINKALDKYIAEYGNNDNISKINKKYFDSYIKAMSLECSPATMRFKYRDTSVFLEEVGKVDLKEIIFQRDKINEIFTRIKEKKKVTLGHIKKGEKRKLSDNPISLATYNCILNQTKCFVRWLNDGETPKGFRDIRQKERAKKDLKVKDMLNYEDIKELLRVSPNPIFSFFLKSSLELGDRISGLLDTKVTDYEHDTEKNIVKVNIDDKTGKRESFFIKAIPEFLRAKEFHNGRSEYMFITLHGGKARKIDYNNIRSKLLLLKKNTNFQKPLNTHNFRHSAIRIAKLEGVPYEIAKRQFGITSESIYDGYGRIDGEDIKEYFLEQSKNKEGKGEKVFSIPCPFCETLNNPDNDFCDKCSNPLSIKALDKEKTKEVNVLKKQLDEQKQREKLMMQRMEAMQNTIAEVQNQMLIEKHSLEELKRKA